MNKKLILVLFSVCLPLVPLSAVACYQHAMLFNPDRLGTVGTAAARVAGLLPPPPVFTLEHPSMTKAVIGERNELTIKYKKPFWSKEVRMELISSSNVILAKDAIELKKRTGVITIPYEVENTGFASISLKVSGVHKGETVQQSARIYVRGTPKTAERPKQVSGL
ncbi:MAG: hypothetical protein AAF542_03975 [Pseudomonadota bacterium]